MTFNALETSLAAGRPVRLYEFERGTKVWRYTSADRDIVLGAQTYGSVNGLSDSGFIWSGDPEQDALTITAPDDLEVALLYRGAPPSDAIYVRVRDMHYGDTEALISWVGTIKNLNWNALDRCEITCQTLEAYDQQPGLTDTYSKTCLAVLGDQDCLVDLESYRVEGSISALDGASITVSAAAALEDNWFRGGFVAWPTEGGQYDRRHIEAHTGSTLTLLGGTNGLAEGLGVRLYPGCDFNLATCDSKYSNSLNFRGEPYLQGESPFDGNQVW